MPDPSCTTCGVPLIEAARFCPQCGAAVRPIVADAPATSYRTEAEAASTGERRQLTAMFCDLVDYTGLSQQLDPEELHEVVVEYQELCAEAIDRYDGHVAQYLGDGVLAYFGFPKAHEDDAERAVRAGLAIQSAIAELTERRSRRGAPGVFMRVGIHTGLVVVTEVGDRQRHETLALGDTITVAARIQGVGEAGALLISEATLRLVPGLFVTHDLGTPALKGVTEPVRIHSVVGSSGVRPRFAVTRPLTPLTGRDPELSELVRRWEHAEEGRGQVVALSGEAGIGKSRLLHALREQLASRPHFTLPLDCSPYTAGSAFQPVIRLYERGLNFAEADPPEQRLRKLVTGLTALDGLRGSQTVPFIAALLGLPESEQYPLEHMSPELQREKTLDALLAPILSLAAAQPLLVTCEDLHWCDRSTLELLGRVMERARGLPVLVVVTYRPDFEPPWPQTPSHLGVLPLSRLTLRNTRAVIEAAAGDGELPAGVVERLVERADGVPLFAEELARSVVDSGQWTGELAIPSTLQDSLMARLDRLPEGKPVAQLASILGRELPFALIEALSDFDDTTLRRGLDQLVEAEILFQRGRPPESTYFFKHALLQDTAYQSQLKSRRRRLHGRAAEILVEQFPTRTRAEPEVIARHFEQGQLVAQAVQYYQQAGEQAVLRLSDSEAVEYFGRALELHAPLPVDDAHRQKEIELRLALNGPQSARLGYDAPETVETCDRVDELRRTLEAGPQQIPALIGLMLFHVNRGHLPIAKSYAQALLEIVVPLGIPSLEVAGRMIVGAASITSSTMTDACEQLERAIVVARAAELPAPKAAFEVDALTVAHCTRAIALVCAGRLETAMDEAERGLRRGRELGHARTYASALVNASMAAFQIPDVERNVALTEECLKLVEGRGFHSVELSAKVQLGWSRAQLGDPDGVVQLEEALADAGSSGAVGGLAQHYFAAAEVYTWAGRYDDARLAIGRAEELFAVTGEQIAFAPLSPLARANIHRAQGDASPDELEALLLDSLHGFRTSSDLWHEMGVAIDLFELAQQTDRRDAALADVASAYAQFTESFDTPRLRGAKAILDASR